MQQPAGDELDPLLDEAEFQRARREAVRASRAALALGAIGVVAAAAIVALFVIPARLSESAPSSPDPVLPAPPASGAAAAAAEVAESPRSATPPPAVAVVAPSVAAVAPPRTEADVLLAQARTAAIEGRKKDALRLFRAAWRIDATNPAFERYVPMLLGKTGEGRLVLGGRGSVTVDGHRFRAPDSFDVAAGPHAIAIDGGPEREMLVVAGQALRIVAGSAAAPPPHPGPRSPR